MVSTLFKWLFIVGILPLLIGAGKHPFYITVTEIEHNTKEKTLEVSCKVFTDDFEKTLRDQYKTNVDLLQPKDKAAMDKLISDYTKKHLLLKIDSKMVSLQYLGYEQKEEAIYSYYQVNGVDNVKKLEVTDNLLYDYKKEQVNIIHITVNGNRKSTRLNNPEDKASFEF